MLNVPILFQPTNVRSGTMRSGTWKPTYQKLAGRSIPVADRLFLCREMAGLQDLLMSGISTPGTIHARYGIARSTSKSWLVQFDLEKPLHEKAGCPNCIDEAAAAAITKTLVEARNNRHPLTRPQFKNLLLTHAQDGAKKRKVSTFANTDELDKRTVKRQEKNLQVFLIEYLNVLHLTYP